MGWDWLAVLLAGATLAVCLIVLMQVRRVADLAASGVDGDSLWDRLDRLEERLGQADRTLRDELARGRGEAAEQARALRGEVGQRQDALRAGMDARFKEIRDANAAQATQSKEELAGALHRMQSTLSDLAARTEERQDKLRETVERRLDALRGENAAKLEEMRQTVDEKLQGTLEQRLGASFKMVSDQLEQVYKSVGEMQALATGVGDLKKVLSNVKVRGTWGEVSLGNLLEQVLTPDQYARNVEVRPGSNQRVEYAIRLPGGDDGGDLWLPLDAKFPQEDFDRLIDAADRADADGVEAAARGLELRVRGAARDIHDKYISPPHSTDFGVLFLPTEGLFAEIARRPGLIDALQRDMRVIVAGPTTLVAILNSLRMGFRSLAIQKRSSEVWQVLGAVKTEFGKYGEVLDKVKRKLDEASTQIDQVAVRRRAIDRRLRGVESLPDADAALMLDLDTSASTAGAAPEET